MGRAEQAFQAGAERIGSESLPD
ncbi:hypothetical protein LINGRAHAP2_LOCUS6017 [Linum grandiflorum]